ncbi:hypothetical protein [Ruminococcus sp.]|uniref:hypothetical protein n=1 Tax=Ruminococcus sp. TaxID=41978 RepID=UPI0025F3DE0F|nr:hypothetical protein [Ruminococcus sp.]MBR1431640.1 hypothetical protein [Ruminococcus sp.]
MKEYIKQYNKKLTDLTGASWNLSDSYLEYECETIYDFHAYAVKHEYEILELNFVTGHALMHNIEKDIFFIYFHLGSGFPLHSVAIACYDNFSMANRAYQALVNPYSVEC